MPGVELGWAEAAIRKPARKDLLVIRLADTASVAGVFTQNRFAAAPVQVCRKHLADGPIRALVVNTGNANAGTGEPGLATAQATCDALGRLLRCSAAVLPFSTGVIMEPLPIDRLIAGLPAAVERLAPEHWLEAAEAIMTTDTLPKAASTRIAVAGGSVTITGTAKGAGMIRPDMATMLGFIAMDAAVPRALLQRMTAEAASQSFNRITIDGDTSTTIHCRHRERRRGRHRAQCRRRGLWVTAVYATFRADLHTPSSATARALPSSSKSDRAGPDFGRAASRLLRLHTRRWLNRILRVDLTSGASRAAGNAGVVDRPATVQCGSTMAGSCWTAGGTRNIERPMGNA